MGAIEEPEEDDDGDEDESDLTAKDIDLVMTQVSCSRKTAIKALRAHDGDMIEAIMTLTTSC